DPDRARAEAREIDRQRASGEPLGPLAGLPITIKDSFEVTGMPTTCGFKDLRDHFPARDADAVTLLRQAGANVFGKTNLPAGASDWQSFNPVYGVSRNPWNPDRTVGGSSGGAAGAVAAGFTSFELGSDIGGSIRIPSHFCGVFGHKPTYGLVPLRGHIPPPPGMLSQPERSEEHTSELQSRENLVCRLLLEKKKYSTPSRAPDPFQLCPTCVSLSD